MPNPPVRRRWRRLILLVLTTLAALGVWAFVIEPNRLVVHRQTVVGAGLPTLRVALVSDLHGGARFVGVEKIRQVVERVNAESPDLVLLLGDYLNNGRHRPGLLKGPSLTPEVVAAELGHLRAPTYAVLGNHDWWFDGERIAAALRAQSITVLENDAAELVVDGQDLWVAGIADEMTRLPDAELALARVPAGATVLAMTHNPDVFAELPSRIALTVAGHTHGGQVALPFFGPLVVPSHFGARYAAGLIVEGTRRLFVTTGVGTSIYPVRFRVPPEFVVLTLAPPG